MAPSRQYFEPIRRSSPMLPRLFRSLFVRIISSVALIAVFTTLFAGRRTVINEDAAVQNFHVLHMKDDTFQRYSPSMRLLARHSFKIASHVDHEDRNYAESKPFSFPSALGNVHVLSPDTFYSEIDDNFFMEVRVRTRGCTKNLFCKARLVMYSYQNEVQISAGYLILSLDKEPRPVTKRTISNVKAATDEQFMKWAAELVKLSIKYTQTNISVPQVYDALRKERDTAITCKSTADKECHTLLPIAPPAPKCQEQPSGCSIFWASLDSATTIEQANAIALDTGCTKPVFTKNYLGVRAPLCKTTCPSNEDGCPDVEKVVFSNFYISDPFIGMQNPKPNCMVSSIKSWYDTYTSTVPDCDSDEFRFRGRTNDRYLFVYDGNHDKNKPEFAEAIKTSEACGGNVPDTAYFMDSPKPEDFC